MKYLAILALCLAFSNASWWIGGCPDLQMADDALNITKVRGLWYEYASEHGHYITTQKEAISNLFLSQTNATSGHTHLEIKASIIDENRNKTYTALNSLTCATELGEGCALKKQGNWFSHNWVVLDTDHFGYAIVQECKSVFGIFHNDQVKVLTRDKTPSRYLKHLIAKDL